jgi:hypothetical protein
MNKEQENTPFDHTQYNWEVKEGIARIVNPIDFVTHFGIDAEANKAYQEFEVFAHNHTYATNSPDGVYEGLAFTEVWQFKSGDFEWAAVNLHDYGKYGTFENYSASIKRLRPEIETRRFLDHTGTPNQQAEQSLAEQKALEHVQLGASEIIEGSTDWISYNSYMCGYLDGKNELSSKTCQLPDDLATTEGEQQADTSSEGKECAHPKTYYDHGNYFCLNCGEAISGDVKQMSAIQYLNKRAYRDYWLGDSNDDTKVSDIMEAYATQHTDTAIAELKEQNERLQAILKVKKEHLDASKQTCDELIKMNEILEVKINSLEAENERLKK